MYTSTSPMVIEASVGKFSTNRKVDVETIQHLLNLKQTHWPQSLLVTGVCDGLLVQVITSFQRHEMMMTFPTGRIEPGDPTLRALIEVPAKPPAPGRKYTTNANEVPVAATVATKPDVIAMLQKVWPEALETGARVLAAQWMVETGGNRCYNWNLGNVKSGVDTPHMYLFKVPECLPLAAAEKEVKDGKGLARLGTAAEQSLVACTETLVIFSPPHRQCRFRAFASLREGVEHWVAHHKRIASTRPGYLEALRAKNAAEVAKLLKAAHYYTASEEGYVSGMVAQLAVLDKELGPLPAPWR